MLEEHSASGPAQPVAATKDASGESREVENGTQRALNGAGRLSEAAVAVEGAKVDRGEMLRYLGHAGQEIAPELAARIDGAVELCERTSAPRFSWRTFPVHRGYDDQGKPVLKLEGSTLELPGADISAHLEGATECVVLACTLGLSNEREARRLAAVDATAAALFSAAGSALVETVADMCSADVLAAAKERGLTAGSRFSPGYGDLPLSVQPHIVRILGADRRMGMTPTQGGFVVPAKSVTAFMGLFEGPRAAVDRRSCVACPAREHCMLRKMGTPCYR